MQTWVINVKLGFEYTDIRKETSLFSTTVGFIYEDYGFGFPICVEEQRD